MKTAECFELSAGPLSTVYYQGRGLLENCSDYLEQVPRVVVISDSNVAPLMMPRLKTGRPTDWLVVGAGERSKNLDEVSRLYSELLRLQVDRGTAIMALGGGVVGDLAGFVAATYLRGLPLFQVPTTLLAMVDSSIGGKVGVDFQQGKNLVGAFYAPRAILADLTCLESLPRAEWSAGMAEVIKHAVLDGEDHLESLFAIDPQQPGTDFVAASAQVKMEVVSGDPKESGRRALLNLGHTLGHALEAAGGFRLRHGEAVALGLLAAHRLAQNRGLLQQPFEHELRQLFERWRLPTVLKEPPPWPRVAEALAKDKKNRGASLTFVLPQRPGQMQIVSDLELHEVEPVFDGLCQR